ncbi:MAG: RNB domain-containing ribonuclease [Treponemataceae bacterium]|nr:RNB domain-containing ribonuclease [Treponemataceae bacterium]
MLTKGNIVLYKNQPALITESGDKYTITFCTAPATPTGKAAQYGTQKVRDKDVVLLAAGPFTSLEPVLKAADGDVPAITASLTEAWELLSSDEETAGDTYDYSDILDYASLDGNGNDCFAIYKALTTDVHFAGTFPSFTLRTQAEIDELNAKAYEKEHEAEIRGAFISRLKARTLDLPGDAKFMQEVEALALGSTDKSKVMKEAGFKETPEKAHQLLLDTGIWPMTKNPHPARHGLSMQSATEALASPPEEKRTIVDHTAWAIDSPWSTDPDDAIAYDGTYYWVHIADPASTVTPGCSIDVTARNRGSTLYIPEGAARMLSEGCLADYALGLCEYDENGTATGKKSNALSFRLQIADDGTIEDVAVLKTKVHVERLSYEGADAEYAAGSETGKALAPLYEAARRNEQRRRDLGGVFIELPEAHITVQKDAEGNATVEIGPSPRYQSSDVVREFMLLAGEGAARFAFKNQISFPFVSQEAPDIPKDIPEGLAGQYRLRRCMRSRSVGVTPSSHAGLGLGMYSQVTSPLRRYSDLISHQQLRAFIDGRELLNKDEMLERISAGDAAAGATNRASRESDLHWTLVYLKQHPEWTGEAVVVELRGKQAYCLIPSIAQETLLTPTSAVELNSVLTVKAGNINIPELSVTYQEV